MAEYGASNIKVLKGLEAVRKRPGMYIGDTSTKGLHHLVYEVVDNSIDEAMAGFCDTIKVTLTKEGSAVIEDNGRGIPVTEHPSEKISAATVVLTVLHAGGKFDKDTYKVSGGLHGVGVSVVNALSKDLHLTVFKDGEIHEQSFKAGIPQAVLEATGTTRKHGTKVEFWPDGSIFKEGVTFQKEILMKRFRELCYLNPNIKIDFRDERDGTKELYHFEGGIKQFVEDMNTKAPLSNAQFFQGKMDDIEIDIALMYCDADTDKSLSFKLLKAVRMKQVLEQVLHVRWQATSPKMRMQRKRAPRSQEMTVKKVLFPSFLFVYLNHSLRGRPKGNWVLLMYALWYKSSSLNTSTNTSKKPL